MKIIALKDDDFSRLLRHVEMRIALEVAKERDSVRSNAMVEIKDLWHYEFVKWAQANGVTL